MLLRFASILVVARQFPRQRRSTLCTEPVTRVRASKALTIAALAAATLLVAIPAGAWLGFAIVTTTFGKL